MSYNFVEKNAVGPWLSLKMSVFSFKMAKTMWSYLPVSVQAVITLAQTLPHLHWYIFARWQLHLGCLATISVSVKSETLRAAVSSIDRGNFCPLRQRGARQRSRAELTCISRERMWVIRLRWKLAFLFLLGISSGAMLFLKKYPNTINALLSILGIYHEK